MGSGEGVLVTGGAGYIGSHVAWALVDRGEKVVILDDLSTGSAKLAPPGAAFFSGCISDAGLVRSLIDQHQIKSVVHLAGSTLPSESLQDPLFYYLNNVARSLSFLDACKGAVRHIVFSSTAAAYAPSGSPVSEGSAVLPATPYGRSKVFLEGMLQDIAHAGGPTSVILRYFNVAGCDPAGRTGHPPKSNRHLISMACDVALGHTDTLEIFGADYDTPDGTCVRDFVHVSDVAQAHLLALDHLRAGGPSDLLNCGYGHGASVRQIIAAVEAQAQRKLNVQSAPRRPGDLGSVVAANSAIVSRLGWRPAHDDLAEIIRSTLRWKSEIGVGAVSAQ